MCAGTIPSALPRPGAGVGTTTMSLPLFDLVHRGEIGETHMPNSCGAIAGLALSAVSGVYLA